MKKGFLNLMPKWFVGLNLLILGTLFSSLSLAQQTTDFPNVRLTGLKRYQGFYVTQIVGQGALSLIQATDNIVTLRSIKKFETLPIRGDMVQFRSARISKEGFQTAYTISLFVVHRNAEFCWRELPDRPTRVEGLSGGSPICQAQRERRQDQTVALVMDALKKPEIDQMILEQTEISQQDELLNSVIQYQFGSMSDGAFILIQ